MPAEGEMLQTVALYAEAADRLRQRRRGIGEMLRRRRKLAEGRDLLGGCCRRLTRAGSGAIRDGRDLFHAPYHLVHPLGLILGLGGERRRKLDRGVEIG